MKIKNKIILAVATVSLAVSAFAALPNYQTFGPAYGNATAGASLIIPSDPVLTPRIVTIQYASDSNTAALYFSAGTTAYVVTGTNLSTTGTSQQINSTNGLTATGALILQKLNNVCYSANYSSFANAGGSNTVTLVSGGFGAATAIGDSIYFVPSTNSLPVGAATNFISGDAIFVGTAGRPVHVQLLPALTTNQLNTVIARYD